MYVLTACLPYHHIMTHEHPLQRSDSRNPDNHNSDQPQQEAPSFQPNSVDRPPSNAIDDSHELQQEALSLHPDSVDRSPSNTTDSPSESGEAFIPEYPQVKIKTPRHHDWAGSWTWEIGGAILSAVGIALLIIFLHFVDGMTYTRWQYSISPNAVVSVISAFAKACMLIPVSSCLGQLKWNQSRRKIAKPLYHFQVLDDASRGPWGSLSVFWKTRSLLAIVGAALTILSVTLDPFAQQVLSFPSRNAEMHNVTAYIQRVEDKDLL